MEKTLLDVLEEHTNGIEISYLKKYVLQLLKAIDYCHKNEIMHRDIKPENVLINTDHVLKICDFGFARQCIPSSSNNNKPPE
mmetsp:Transcript_15745/g.12980  ORF Transcript_15745/g.12980 Transcript_15745/m.12980 type:complete len:82 (+) Transcript_15745:240-485(+)